MSGDDILWRKVDELKAHKQEPKSPMQQSPQSPETPPEQISTKKTVASRKAEKPASELASYQDSRHESQIESIRKVVKTIGKEVAFVRLTPEEKRRLEDIVYAFKRQEIKTSENELLRIALNHLLDDYQENGKESVLAKVIAALNA